MANQRKVYKTIRFYELTMVDEKGNEEPAPVDTFDSLWEGIQKANQEQRTMTKAFRRIGGWAKHGTTGPYLKIGRIRDISDNPDIQPFGKDEPEALEVAGRLVESALIVPVPGSNKVATVAAGQAPQASVISSWLSNLFPPQQVGHSYSLIPVLNEKAQTMLKRAKRGINLSITAQGPVNGTSTLAECVNLARNRPGLEDIGVTLRLSAGQYKKGSSKGEALLHELNEAAVLADDPSVTALKASVRLDNEEGDEVTEVLDFISNLLTAKVTFGVDPDKQVEDGRLLAETRNAIERHQRLLLT